MLRYQPGWELFFFTIESPFYDKGPLTLLNLALWGDRVDPAYSNANYVLSEVWNNKLWHHKDVVWAMGETVLMAFLAASNFAPLVTVRVSMCRVFDFVRGVDSLIWTIILSRAFGPGPMTGALAMMITDTGSFGKTFSEALENIDEKQVEASGPPAVTVCNGRGSG